MTRNFADEMQADNAMRSICSIRVHPRNQRFSLVRSIRLHLNV